MEPMQQLGRLLLSVGAMFILIGALFYFAPKLPFRLGRLPGDISYRGEHNTFYFPIVSCLVISIVASLILWLINQLRR
jgi:preprotein translocase subunit SecE